MQCASPSGPSARPALRLRQPVGLWPACKPCRIEPFDACFRRLLAACAVLSAFVRVRQPKGFRHVFKGVGGSENHHRLFRQPCVGLNVTKSGSPTPGFLSIAGCSAAESAHFGRESGHLNRPDEPRNTKL